MYVEWDRYKDEVIYAEGDRYISEVLTED